MTRYDVTWHSAVVKLPSTFLSIGICGKTGKASHYALFHPDKPINEDFLKVFVIRNVYVDDDGCEDAPYCINLDCPHNRAILEHFKTKGITTRHQLEKLHHFIDKLATDLELEPKGAVVLEYETPLATVKKKR